MRSKEEILVRLDRELKIAAARRRVEEGMAKLDYDINALNENELDQLSKDMDTLEAVREEL